MIQILEETIGIRIGVFGGFDAATHIECPLVSAAR
jgi:hypothetical protein